MQQIANLIAVQVVKDGKDKNLETSYHKQNQASLFRAVLGGSK